MLNEKTSAEEKKLKLQARKNEMIQMIQKLEGNALAMKRAKEPPIQPDPESESEISDQPPAKRAKKSKGAVAKPKPRKTKKSSSPMGSSVRAPKKRRPVEPAVSSTEESSGSDVEHESVLQLW